MIRALPALALLAGCDGTQPQDRAAPDPKTLAPILSVSRPESLMDLVLDTREALGAEEDCPSVTAMDEGLERWMGGCRLSDGTQVEGELTRYDGPEGVWVAADGFTLRDGAGLALYLDGAVELIGEGDQMTLDVAASLCGVGLSCDAGVATADLSFILYPLTTWPTNYDASVTGVVALGGSAPTAVDGTWSVDVDQCSSEPVDGIFTLARGERHALTLDGQTDCDGCATWNVQGLQVGEYCGIDL